MVRIGVDTGGTFTDVVLHDRSSGEVLVAKTPTTPAHVEEGVLNGVQEILDQGGRNPERVQSVSHGTTVSTNAVLENEMSEIGLITNEGFRDVIEIGKQIRPDLVDLQTDKPPALVPRYRRKEVAGRIDSNGNELESIDRQQAEQAVTALVKEGVDSIVVALHFSFLNNAHERVLGEIIDGIDGEIDYALSSEIHPELGEYERVVTTVINEGTKKPIDTYLGSLEAGIRDLSIGAALSVMHCGGGVFSVDQARKHAIRTILSGPAAGAVAARNTGEQEGFLDVIGMDMGGTSTDISFIRNGVINRKTENEINGLPIRIPMVDVNTVGAGGGSIARVDEAGALRVGPKSAGAIPGPVCYDRGGEAITITDANLMLGWLNPTAVLGSEVELAPETTRRVFEESLAPVLDRSVEEAALDIVDVAVTRLVRNIRKVTVERGHDPSEFGLVAFGGMGPQLAPAVAESMGITQIIVPKNPGVFSARGLLSADVRVDESHFYRGGEPDITILNDQYEELVRAVRTRLREQGYQDPSVARSMDLRYHGQSYDVNVPLDESGPITQATVERCEDRFHGKHDRLYGHALRDRPVEIRVLRVTGTIPIQDVIDRDSVVAHRSKSGSRDVYFRESGYVETDIYNRSGFSPVSELVGPVVIEDEGSTTVVPPSASVRVSDAGNIRISLDEA